MWDLEEELGPWYRYFPNGSKTHGLAKPQHIDSVKAIFEDTGIVISTEGERYLGGVLGSSSFVQKYVERTVECIVNKVEKLSRIAET